MGSSHHAHARRARAALAAPLLLLGACASQRPAEVRELAKEEYVVRWGDRTVGWERLTLSTLSNYGKRLVAESERTYPEKSKVHIDARLSPDWSIHEATIVRTEADGARFEWNLTFDAKRQVFDVVFASSRAGHDAHFEIKGPYVHADSAALALILARTHHLVQGAPPIQVEAVCVCHENHSPLTDAMAVQRLPDRGRRQVYRYRMGFSEWTELETDQRGLPLYLTTDGMTIERKAEASPVLDAKAAGE